jgi:TRAP-type C4-dicarboxylate transport system permease large subunit
MLLIAGATVFGHFITRTAMPMQLANWVSTLDVSPAVIMLIIIIFWFFLGCFIDAMPIVVLLVPILLPIITSLGYDLIWFAVVVTSLSMVAVVTPPVGVNAYVVKGILEDVPLTTIFKGIFPFLIPFAIGIAIIIAFPSLSTFLTEFITY